MSARERAYAPPDEGYARNARALGDALGLAPQHARILEAIRRGWSAAETARVVGCEVGTVKSRTNALYLRLAEDERPLNRASAAALAERTLLRLAGERLREFAELAHANTAAREVDDDPASAATHWAIAASWGPGEDEVRALSSSDPGRLEQLCKAVQLGWEMCSDAGGGDADERGVTFWPRDRGDWDREDSGWSGPPASLRSKIHAEAVRLGLLAVGDAL